MPRIRYLKPDFFTDEHIAELPYEARLVFQGLWCLADREGRLEDRPKHLKVMLMPYDNIDMDKNLERLSTGAKPFISRYTVEGHEYIQILNFMKHQKPHHTEKDSVLPVEDKENEKDNGKEKIKRSVHEASTELSNGVKTVKTPLKGKCTDIYNVEFLEFWKVYPYKTAKDKAWIAWQKLNPPLNDCIKTLGWQIKTDGWKKENGKYIPMPTTWLNGGRWKDEPIKGITGGKYDGIGIRINNSPAACNPWETDPDNILGGK